jgi:ketosteroid isomerase-like protein
MRTQGGGLIINIGSILGRVTFPFFGAMSALTPVRAFYDAVASGDVTRILSILHPNLAWTEAEGFPYFSGTWHHPQEVVEKLLIPLGRDWEGLRQLHRSC